MTTRDLEIAVPQIMGRPTEETVELIQHFGPYTSLQNAQDYIGLTHNKFDSIDVAVLLSPGYVMNEQGPRLLNLNEPGRGSGAVSGGQQRAEAIALMVARDDYDLRQVICTSRGHHSTGDTGDWSDHWEAQQDVLVNLGVPKHLFAPETVSIDTATEISELLVRTALSLYHNNVAVVTNRYHLPRALAFARLLWLYGETDDVREEARLTADHDDMVQRLLRRTNQGYSTPFSDQHVARVIVQWLYDKQVYFHFVAAEDVLAAYNNWWPIERNIYAQADGHIRELFGRELFGLNQLLNGTYGRPKSDIPG